MVAGVQSPLGAAGRYHVSWHDMTKTESMMIMTELKPPPGEILGDRFADETWQEIFSHCLDHDPYGLPWCTMDTGV